MYESCILSTLLGLIFRNVFKGSSKLESKPKLKEAAMENIN
jgi:hypothetical protein